MKPVDISLITSLYKAESFLSAYAEAVLALSQKVNEAGIAIELVLVPNDPSAKERIQIESLQSAVDCLNSEIKLHVVPTKLESIYASWNRGLRVATGTVIGFWGVDDVRYAEAIVEGCRLIASGCDIVDFPSVTRIDRQRFFGLFRSNQVIVSPVSAYPAHHISPFFLASHDSFARFGYFDEYFRINGDMEWATRAIARGARRCYGQQRGGVFHLHGGNLSANRPDMAVEINLIHLRQVNWQDLRPAEPDMMRQAWLHWPGAEGIDLPAEIQDRLWGEQAQRNPRGQGWNQLMDSLILAPARHLRNLWRHSIRRQSGT